MRSQQDLSSQALDLLSLSDQALYSKLGDQLQDIALDTMLGEGQSANFDKNELLGLALATVDEVSKRSAEELKHLHQSGIKPSMSNQLQTGEHFFKRISRKLTQGICEELYSEHGPSDNARDLVVILVPTVIAILSIPAPYSAIAAPLAALVAKVGLRSLCAEHPFRVRTIESIRNKLELHENNLSYLEQTRARYTNSEPPPELLRMIAWEEEQVQSIRAELERIL